MEAVLFILTLTITEVLSGCVPKNGKLVNFQETFKRSQPVTLGITVENCPGETAQFYRWELKDLSNNKVIKIIRSPFFPIEGYTLSHENIFGKTFQITSQVSHNGDYSDAFTIKKTFKFVPENMHIEIKGGPEVSYPIQQNYEIDARTLSKDPSFRPNEHSIEDNDIEWTIKPKIPGYTPPKSLLLEIPYPKLKENNTYQFTVKVTRNKIPSAIDVQTATQTVTIIPSGIPKIKLECVRNCENSHPEEKSAFRAVCTENCQNLNYEWTTKPKLKKSQTDLGNGFAEFVIEEGSFKPGDTVNVILRSGVSTSSYTLSFRKKMAQGNCVIKPKKGISGTTLFNIDCIGFNSTNKNLKYMIYQMKDGKGVIINEDNSKEDSDVYLSEGNPAKIRVEVHDDFYELKKVELEVQVDPFPLHSTKEAFLALKDITLDEYSQSAITEKLRNQVVQTVSYLLDAINNLDTITPEKKADLHKHLAESLEMLSSYDFDSSSQMISILTKLQKFKIKTDIKTGRIIGKSALDAAAIAQIYSTRNRSVSVPVTFKKKLLENLFYLSSKLLDEVPQLKAALDIQMPAHDYDSYDDMLSFKLSIADDLRETANNMFIAIQCLGIAVLDKNLPDQKPIVFQNDLMNFETRRIKLTTLLEKQNISLTDDKKNKVFVPEPLIMELQSKYAFIDYQFGVLQKNSFYWHPNVSKFNTDIVLFDFFYQNLKINSMENPFYVHLRVKKIPTGVIKGSLKSRKVAVHRVKVQPGSMLIIVFKAEKESFRVAASKCYCDDEDFANGVQIQNGANETERTLRAETHDYQNMYVCVKKSGAELHYRGDFTMFSCLYWDLKMQVWNKDGSNCVIHDASLKQGGTMVCKCKHSSFFTGEIFAPPNFINFNIELNFFIAIKKNWFVVLLIVGILLLWSIFLIIAAKLDRKFMRKNKIHRLDDNMPGDCHLYLLVVFTGIFIDASSTADVAFQLIGEKAKSRVHLIKCKGVRMLRRNSQDWFVINTPKYLGDLKMLRLWHNCRGLTPHWYCKRIVVQHLKSGTQYCFIVEKWFSLIWGNGQIYREIHLEDDNYLKSGKLLLSINAETMFKDKHLWISVFTRDWQSNFSSVERVGTIGCTFFLSMLASAMFYGIPKNVPSDSIDPKSSYFITYRDIIIFLESWVVAVPIGIIVVLIFRNSAPRRKYES